MKNEKELIFTLGWLRARSTSSSYHNKIIRLVNNQWD